MSARIVIIEDNPANLELMTYLLQAFGHTTIGATDGREGIELVRKEQPDLVVCDIQMPGVDGFEVARQLKSYPTTRAIPLIAVTALAMVGDRDKILSAGFDGYLAKPIVPETFVGHVETYIRNSLRSAPLATPEASSPNLQKPDHYLTILVVDDTPTNIEVARSILEPNGYEVLGAPNVHIGLIQVREILPDLILTDLHMPHATGFEFIETLKADPLLKHIPIILISSTIWAENDKGKGLDLGAVKFITRPIEPERFLAEIESCLPKSKEE
jgi:two-component system, cell cycle response regulator